ncbi:MAG: hypothetical protein BECKG1743D_GA0114223_109601 [Candidatus Kentron sp. G]|nr:MAG: hypothetical protein BECKG1743D_GA0114223_109601 [Candidatus Kentron sp. G]
MAPCYEARSDFCICLTTQMSIRNTALVFHNRPGDDFIGHCWKSGGGSRIRFTQRACRSISDKAYCKRRILRARKVKRDILIVLQLDIV